MRNDRRHRAYLKRLTADIDRMAGWVLREVWWQFAFACGFECRWCHRPLERDEGDHYSWRCPCKHCFFQATICRDIIHRTPRRFARRIRQFQEAA